MDPGMFSSGQSPSPGPAYFRNSGVMAPTYGVLRGGGPGYYGQHSGIFPNAPALTSDNVKSIKQEECVHLLEQALLNVHEKPVDAKEIVHQIRVLVAQAEETVQQIGKLVMIDPKELEPNVVACPFNYAHRTPPEALFRHFLSCPSNPKPCVDAKNLWSSVRYLNTRPEVVVTGLRREDEDHKTLELECSSLAASSTSENRSLQVEAANIQFNEGDRSVLTHAKSEEKAKLSYESTEIDIWGGRFLYGDCPAVVQGPFPTPFPSAQYVDELESKVWLTGSGHFVPSTARIGGALVNGEACGDDVLKPLLPSRLWFLLRETELWRELPTRCSSVVLQAAMALKKVRKAAVFEWLLLQGPSHGIVIDSALASHIYTLLEICLRSLQEEASSLIGYAVKSVVKGGIETPESNVHSSHGPGLKPEARVGFYSQNVNQGGAAEVKQEDKQAVIQDAASRQTFKLTIFDCPQLFQSGKWLASQLFSLFGPLQSNVFVLNLLKHCLGCSGRLLSSCFIDAFLKHTAAAAHKEKIKEAEPVEGMHLQLEWAAAHSAVYERAVLESYLKSLSHPSNLTKFQRVKEHEALVSIAADERRKRENYRAVLEYDGLIWHRSQLEEKNKNKTREEQLAEERDYKRRRMSYRGKKLKRNHTQVLHDIIHGHMEEITEAGGIGLFTKHPGDVRDSLAGISEVGLPRTSDGDDVVKLSSLDVDKPFRITPSNLDARNLRSPSDHARDEQGRRGEHVTGRSGNVSEESNYSSPQGIKSSRLETGGGRGEDTDSRRYRRDGSQGRSYRDYSPHNSNRYGEDSRTYHGRNRSDHDRGFKEHKQDRYDNSSEKHHDRYDHSQRYTNRWNGLVEDDGFERYPKADERIGRSKG